MFRSLRRRLMAILSASISVAWLASAGFTYLDAREEIDAMLDAGVRSADLRAALAESVAAHLMHPLLIAVPVLGLILWLSVAWGLAPLRVLAEQVRARNPEDNSPISVPAPEEVKPLVAALDGLFRRVGTLIERERRFTADAAHELRTPLAGIRTHAQVALAAGDENERRAALAAVVEGTERAHHLVEQLLMLARLEAVPAVDAVDLGKLAARMVGDFSDRAADNDIDLGLAAVLPDAVVQGDENLIAVMVRNLLDNALLYVPAGGRIDIVVRHDADALEIAILDDGPGIAPDERPRALERFHRGFSTAEGCGLGLSIVARIAELHGGAVALGVGLKGRGLGVRVSFPL